MSRNGKRKVGNGSRDATARKHVRKASDTSAAGVNDALPPGLAAPARRALAGAGITQLEQFTKMTEADLSKLHGMGPKALGIIRAALKERAQAFKA